MSAVDPDRAATAALVAGYVAAVPLTLFVPGFLRMWRRRERWVFATAELGALLITVGWAVKGNLPAAVVNGAWTAGFALAYAAEGRKRAAAGR
jgi:hypothetical protein